MKKQKDIEFLSNMIHSEVDKANKCIQYHYDQLNEKFNIDGVYFTVPSKIGLNVDMDKCSIKIDSKPDSHNKWAIYATKSDSTFTIYISGKVTIEQEQEINKCLVEIL